MQINDPGLLSYFQDKDRKLNLMKEASKRVRMLPSFQILQELIKTKYQDKKNQINNMQSQEIQNQLNSLEECTFGEGFKKCLRCYSQKTKKINEKQDQLNEDIKNKFYEKCNLLLDHQFNKCFDECMLKKYDEIYKETIESLEGKENAESLYKQQVDGKLLQL